MNAAVRFTVVVSCGGEARLLVSCLRSIARQTPHFAFETIVVDRNCDVRVVAATRQFPGVRVVRGNRGLRGAEARSLGAHQSHARYLAFVDGDCYVGRTWLETANEGLSGGAVLVGGPVLPAHPWHPVAAADHFLHFAEFGPRRPSGRAESWPSCNVAVRREDFLHAGGSQGDGSATAGAPAELCARIGELWPTRIMFARAMQVRRFGRRSISELLRHQADSGRGDGRNRRQARTARRYGSRGVALPAFRRLIDIVRMVVIWDPAGLPRLALALPLVASGLCAWALAFRGALRETATVSE